MNWEYVVMGIAGLASLWLSLKVLGFLFRLARRVFGWLGPLALACLPAVLNYVALYELGVGRVNASLTSLVVGLLVGALSGRNSGDE